MTRKKKAISRFDTTVLSKAHEDELMTELAGRVPNIRAHAALWGNVADVLRATMKKETKKFNAYCKRWKIENKDR